jgi:hypothetical protein
VADQGRDVPLGTRRGIIPLLRPDLPDKLHHALGRGVKGVHGIHGRSIPPRPLAAQGPDHLTASIKSVVPCAGIRTCSDQFVTSASSPCWAVTFPERCGRSVRFVGEVQPAPRTSALIGGWGIQMRARTVRWVAGCAAAGSVALMGGGLALAYVDRHLVPASLTGWTVSNISDQLVNVSVAVIGFVLASRRPANRIGWLFLAAGLTLGLSAFSQQYALHALVAHPGSWPAGRAFAWLSNWTSLVPVTILAFLLLLFPTGYLRSRRWRPAGWFLGGVSGFVVVWGFIAATRLWAHPFSSTSGQGWSGLIGLLFLMTAILISAALLVGLAALVVRFAKSSGEERLQLKWCAAAALVVVVMFVASIWVNSAAVNLLQSLAFVFLWTAIAIAVLKYRLYEIDHIISRTVAYTIVTGVLVGVYAGLVLLATRILSLHTPVAVAASTLAAAALFNPLRRRVQQVADRRFNRARYDADQTIAAFAASLKDAVDLDSVRDGLATAVHQALEPAHVSVWIRPPG